MGNRRAFAVLTLICHVLLAGLVVRDARQRDRDARLWGVLTLVTGFLGALAYRASR